MDRIKLFSCISLLLTVLFFATRLGHANVINSTLDLQEIFEEEWGTENTGYDYGSDVSSYFNFIPNNSSNTVTNVTLDVLNNTVIPRGFEISALQPGWFEYFNSSFEFVGGGNGGNPDSCATTHSNLPSFLGAVEGAWTVCANCWNASHYPSITYKNNHAEFEGLRTLKFRYYLSGVAALRLSVQGECFDYSIRQNTSSKCTFLGMGNEREGWRQSIFTIEYENATTLRVFKIELITESKADLILFDKVEGTSIYIDAEEEDSVSASTFMYASCNVILCVICVVFYLTSC